MSDYKTALETKRICDVKCKPIPTKKEEDTRPIKGVEILSALYANVYACARKHSGKTCTIYQIIKRCAGRDTIVIAFVSTLNNDDGWIGIKDYCKKHKIAFIGYTSIFEDGADQLQALMSHLQEKAAAEQAAKDAPPAPPPRSRYHFGDESKGTAARAPRKLPYRAPDYILVFDDLAHELKTSSVATMLKKNRHFRFKSIVSSQWLNDIPPDALRMMDNVLLYRGHSKVKLIEIHEKAGLKVPLHEFLSERR
jgi:hypothetical protein